MYVLTQNKKLNCFHNWSYVDVLLYTVLDVTLYLQICLYQLL